MENGTVYHRRKRIAAYLKKNGSATTEQLSKQFSVSEITIRRDLKGFENEKFLERFHGGVRLLNERADNEVIYEEKGARFSHEKSMIAREVIKLLEINDTVFLNSGSTSLAILKEFNHLEKPIRVITNNALAPTAIVSDNIELMMTGGEYREKSKSLVGDLAEHAISRVFASVCILGVNGISTEGGITTSVYQETAINELMVSQCKGKCIIVADGSKVGQVYNFKSIELEKIDLLITDPTADQEHITLLEHAGVDVIIAGES